MLSAYQGWMSTASRREINETFPYLYMVVHLPDDTPPPSFEGRSMPTKLCNTHACFRCTVGRGGYQFRWVDRRWLPIYESLRRPGSRSFQ